MSLPLIPEGGLASSASAALQTANTQQTQPLDQVGKLIESIKAINTTPGVPAATMRSTPVAAPMPAKEQAGITTDNREFRTSSGNKRVAFNNLMQNITGMVNTAAKNEDAKKARSLSLDMERLFAAQTGMQQAQDALKSNPNDTEAKKILQQNTQIVNDIMGDPKKRKNLEKAFNFSIIGDDKNKDSWQRKAFTEAAKKYQEAQKNGDTALNPYADVFMKSQPTQLTANPQYQAYLDALKNGSIVSEKDKFSAISKIIQEQQKGQTTVQGKEVDAQAKVKAAEVSAKQRAETATEHFKTMKEVAQKTYDRVIKAAQIRAGATGSSNNTANKELNNLAKFMQMNLKEIDKATEEFDTAKSWWHTTDGEQKAATKLKQLQMRQKLMENKANQLMGMQSLESALDDADTKDTNFDSIDKDFGDDSADPDPND